MINKNHIFLIFKFFPLILIFTQIEEILAHSLTDFKYHLENTLPLLVFLAVLQLLLLRLENIKINDNNFEITGWYKYSQFNWSDAVALNVLKAGSPNFGRIIMKNGKKYYFTDFLQSPESYRKMKEMIPWFFDRETGKAMVAPNEVHQMLEWGVNTLLKKQVDMFLLGFQLKRL